MRKQVAIIGHFGGNKEFLDGQTVKTKILYNELKIVTDWDIQIIDTYFKSKKPISLLITTLIVLIKRKNIIVLLSGNGMKFYFPLLSFFAKHWKNRIFHDVIGGNLDKYVKECPRFKKYLNSFVVNWVETKTLKKKLEKKGITNCEVIPNFKRLNIIDFHEPVSYGEPYHFCTFSRVMKEKGIESAISAIEEINKKAGREVCTLDIYGAIDSTYKVHFDETIRKSTTAIHYCGSVPYDMSVEVIKKYFALLFPTFWDGEGFPGTIVDAFSAGLPVIATDWNCNAELITDGVNGIIYSLDVKNGLMNSIEKMIGFEEETISNIKKNCIEKAKEYMPQHWIERIVQEITELGC